MDSLNQNGQKFAHAIASARRQFYEVEKAKNSAEKLHIVGAGRALTSAYEQLRNAAEYTEEHLLLQRAIRRFYKRTFLTNSAADIHTSGDELITELTLAGYIKNDSVPVALAKDLSILASEYYSAYSSFHSPTNDQADRWCIDVLAVEVEARLNDLALRDVFVQFAFEEFTQSINPEKIFKSQKPAEYELALYAAVHRALLKSDDATIRWALLRRFQQSPNQLVNFKQTNQMIDELLDSKTTDRLSRIVGRQGAGLRVLWRFISDHDDAAEQLARPAGFLSAYEAQILSEYNQIDSRITRGIIKSVMFLIITKFLIGIAIEVPYDIVVHGEILWVPLVVNLLLPPIYMVLLRFTLSLPGPANTKALVGQIDDMLYKEPASKRLTLAGSQQQYSAGFNIVYGLLFVAIFGLMSWGLVSIGFSAVHLLIFFVFFSAASFLGFRLSRTIRELETVDSEQSGVALIRDIIYMPFVVVGQKLSEGYSRFNVIAIILDMLIELPMKTVLRLVRQWGSFISAKKDYL